MAIIEKSSSLKSTISIRLLHFSMFSHAIFRIGVKLNFAEIVVVGVEVCGVVTGHLSDADICPTRTFVRQTVQKFADICPTRTFFRQSHFKCILKTISYFKGAISGDYR